MKRFAQELKFNCMVFGLFDIKVYNAFVKLKVTASMIKCAHGINPYEVKMSMINKNQCRFECPRCSEVETREHVIKYKKIMTPLKELTSKCPSNTNHEEILSFVKDILRCFENDDGNECETNQGLIGFQNVF